jgi:NDP-sugar pyrophosphorylase family protein
MKINSAVVLAAGEGQRLRPLTQFRPKPMLPAGNRPILERVFDALIDAGIDDLHVVVGYMRDRVRDHFGPTYRDRTITYHTQGKQLGSGHALFQAADAIEDDFLVVNGDEVIASEMIDAVMQAHAPRNICTLAVIESDRAQEFGAVELDGDRVSKLIERPKDGVYRLMNAGVYAFGPSIFSEIEQMTQTGGERGLTDTVVQLIERSGNVYGVRTDSHRTEVTYPWDLLALSAALLDRGEIDCRERTDGVYVHDRAMVHDDAILRSPVVVGPETVVEPGTVVGPNVALGQNTTVEAGATLRRCVIDDDTRVGRNTTLLDTVTGTDVEIAAGVTAPAGPSDVRIDTTIYGGEQLGAGVADRAEIGGGVTLAPGVLIGPEALIAPGGTIRHNVDANVEVTQ